MANLGNGSKMVFSEIPLEAEPARWAPALSFLKMPRLAGVHFGLSLGDAGSTRARSEGGTGTGRSATAFPSSARTTYPQAP